MSDQQERYYNIFKLNKWFALSSVIFLGIWVIVFADDYQRTWKKYQQEFRNLEIEKLRQNITNAEIELDKNPEYEKIIADLEIKQSELSLKAEEIEKAEKNITRLENEKFAINKDYQFSKAEADAAVFIYEEAQAGHGDLDLAAAEFNEWQKKTSLLKAEVDLKVKELQDAEDELPNVLNSFKILNDKVAAFTRKKDLLERKLEKTDPESMSLANKISNVVRDLPILDFMDPYYEVKQIVIKDLKEDLVFMGVPRVDRCVTCHLGIDRKGFEDAPQPFTTHPKLELFLSGSSAHPIAEYGCTGCHSGRSRGTDFNSAAHSPNNADDRNRWQAELGWEPLHHWGDPMLPMKHVEASCYKCHNGTMPVKGAPKLSLGLAVVEKSGCFGCHEIERWQDRPKPGPGLRKIASKISRKFAYKWIKNPENFRHDTWMPKFFELINSEDDESRNRSNQEIHAIVSYLFNRSEPYSREKLPGRGNSEQGRELVNSLGCKGCHRVEVDQELVLDNSFNSMRRQQGPNLIYMGSKTNQKWIYNWLLNPQGYHVDTKMPNMRLNEQESLDISAFLIGPDNDDFDNQVIPEIDELETDKIVVSFLEQSFSNTEVAQKLAEMDISQKLNFAGERLIRHYGCFSCHDIGGFENSKPIGTPLTYEGSKLISKLDFAYMHDEIPHTNWDWFRLKLHDPRIFDMIPQSDGAYGMKVKAPLEKARMPHFNLNQEELDAVVTVLLGFVDDDIPESKLPSRTTRNLIVEDGERLIQTYNCKGCHKIDGDGGAIVPTVQEWLSEIGGTSAAEDMSLVQSFSPPILDTEGRKVQPKWLFHFLKEPTMIRPNLQLRMPSFSMVSDDNWNKFIKYFQYKDNQLLAYENPHIVSRNSSAYKAGSVIQDLGACNNCHFYGQKKPLQSALTWAPNLALTKERLRPDWVIEWLRDPQLIMPGTKMPAPYLPVDEPLADVQKNWGKDVAALHPDNDKMLAALRDYIWAIPGPSSISGIVKAHLASQGYGFIIEEEGEDDWEDEDW